MILILKNVNGSSGCRKIGKLSLQTNDSQKAGALLHCDISQRAVIPTSLPWETGSRLIPLTHGGNLGGVTLGVTTSGTGHKTRTSSAEKGDFFLQSLRTQEGVRTKVAATTVCTTVCVHAPCCRTHIF